MENVLRLSRLSGVRELIHVPIRAIHNTERHQEVQLERQFFTVYHGKKSVNQYLQICTLGTKAVVLRLVDT